jgi:uncharacterized delta-60 repeat protein
MKALFSLLFSVCLFCFTTQAQLLDDTFGNNGLVINNLTQGIDGIYGMAIQHDGKIITSGTANGTFVLVRYNTNGTFDSSFGNNGIVQTNFSFTGGQCNIIIQSDNKILVQSSNNYKPFIARYNTNGTLDNTFGTNGMVYIIVQNKDNSSTGGMLLTQDGKIVLLGRKPGNAIDPTYIFLIRLNADGSIDTHFGPDGTGLSLLAPTINYQNGTAMYSTARNITLNSNGDLFVQLMFNINTETGYITDYGVLKYSSSGIRDQEFGEGGIAPAHVNHNGQIIQSGIKILDDDKIISIARKNYYPLPKRGLLLTKYNTDGSLDTSFGTNGFVETTVDNSIDMDLEILANKKIFIAGDNLETFTSILYEPNGQIDITYGDNGFFVYKFEPLSYDYGRVVAKQTDGKIIIAGSTSHQCANRGFALMRLNIEQEIATDINENNNNQLAGIQFYPNPTNGKITINLPKQFSDIDIKILSTTGQQILYCNFKNTNQIDLNPDLKSGMYFVQIIDATNVVANLKVVKE